MRTVDEVAIADFFGTPCPRRALRMYVRQPVPDPGVCVDEALAVDGLDLASQVRDVRAQRLPPIHVTRAPHLL